VKRYNLLLVIGSSFLLKVFYSRSFHKQIQKWIVFTQKLIVNIHHYRTLKFNHMSKMNPVVHFEMPANDRKRMADFYTIVFGWKAEMLGEEMGNYVTVATTEADENGRPKNPGAINGGFYPKTADTSPYPSIVIAVDDIKESVKKISDSGGKILGEPVTIPGIGLWVSFTDTEGNRVSILQPLNM
jgi:predicted enzyme related to lactoylglutathione lyase